MLIDSFKDDEEVQPMKMSSRIDDKTGDVEFLYKFEQGFTLESQGIYIAKMAKVPDSILQVAKIQSDFFREKLRQLEQKCNRQSKKIKDNDVEMEPSEV